MNLTFVKDLSKIGFQTYKTFFPNYTVQTAREQWTYHYPTILDNIPLRSDFWSKLWPANFPAGVNLQYMGKNVINASQTIIDRFAQIGFNMTAGTFWLDGMKI